MKWDAQYTTAHRMSLDEALSRLKVQKPEWADPENPVLLLVAMPLVDPAAEGYQLLYRTPGRPWFVPSEVYYLYVPSTATRGGMAMGVPLAADQLIE